MKEIGLLGGTFDPPHIGHLMIADQVQTELGLDEIWFIPTYEPPHKAKTKTSVHDRLTMLKYAIESNSSFKINEIEIMRKGKSYTIDTIDRLKDQYVDRKFYFIIGADMVEYLPHWHRIDELIERITFVGVERPGYQVESIFPIKKISIPIMDISSSFLRERIKAGKSIRYFVPEKVFSYIKENQLYED